MSNRLSRGRSARALIAVFAVLAAFFAATALASSPTVKVGDNYFSIHRLTVHRGTTVHWKWVGALYHNVKVKSGPVGFHSRKQYAGSYSHDFTVKGTYHLYCTLHPDMTMTVIVK